MNNLLIACMWARVLKTSGPRDFRLRYTDLIARTPVEDVMTVELTNKSTHGAKIIKSSFRRQVRVWFYLDEDD